VADLELERDTHGDDRHSKRLRPDIGQLEDRLRRAEQELAANDSLRDALRAEKARVSHQSLQSTVCL
jgi:septal ring factor EnvC (AmiA/AmiB activator)